MNKLNMNNVDLKRFKEYLNVTLPENVENVPSMMSKNEKKFLYSLVKKYFKCEGLIIDAGTFLGGSTVCLGEGVLENALYDGADWVKYKPVRSFDRTQIYPNFFEFCKRNGIDSTGYEIGGSFEPVLRKNIESVSGVVDLLLGDVTQKGSIEEGIKIEILFLDVIKRADINQFVLKNWFDKLIPGHSIVIQQDYYCEGVPHIPVSQEYLSEYFSYIGQIHSTAIFLLEKEVPQELLETDYQKSFDIEKQMEMIDAAKERTPFIPRKFLMDVTKIILAKKLQGPESELASKYLNELENTYPDIIKSDNKRLQRALRSARTFKTEFI